MTADTGGVEETRPGFEHEALFYRDDDDFLAGLVPFVREGLASTGRASWSLPRGRMDAAPGRPGRGRRRRPLARDEELGRNPARIIGAWADALAEATADGRTLRGVGEPAWYGPAGRSSCRVPAARAAAEPRLRRRPAWRLLCPYDEVAAAAGGVRPRAGGPPDPLDLRRRAAQRPVHPGTATSSLRRAAGAAAARVSCGASSAVPRDIPATRHTVGPVRPHLRALRRQRRGARARRRRSSRPTASATAGAAARSRCGCRTTPPSSSSPTPGTSPTRSPAGCTPSHEQEGGRGLFLVHQLCDLVQLRSSPEGTTVRVVTWL